MVIILRIGGSVLASPLDSEVIGKYSKLLMELAEKEQKIVAIVGGGSLARKFITIGRKLGLIETSQDLLAIEISRILALLLSLSIDSQNSSSIPTTINNALEDLKMRNVVIMGGLKPGMTTDTVAALIAKSVKAKMLVKATDQDGIYDKDPKKYHDAEKLDNVTFSQLSSILEKSQHEAGIHQIIDPVALNILQEINGKVVIVNGQNPDNIKYAIEGRKIGTIIQ